MVGAIIGDIVGSRFEEANCKRKDFELFTDYCFFTDDSVLTMAIAAALVEWKKTGGDLSALAVDQLLLFGLRYPDCGFGLKFLEWIPSLDHRPYDSWGNGSAMRVSPVGWVANSLDEAIAMSDAVTRVTHNHPEGMAGAAVTAACVYMARTGASMKEMLEYVTKTYSDLSFTLDSIRENYVFDVSCRGSVPQALEAFFESTSFEDAIRNAISIGGDSDTIGAITGSIAGAYYGVPNDIRDKALSYLDDFQLETISEFEALWPEKRG